MLRYVSSAALALGLVLGVLPASPALAAPTTFYVGTTADQNDGGDCTNPSNMDCSLRDAILAANANGNPGELDVIEVPNNTYPLTGASDEDAGMTGDLDITQAVEINFHDSNVIAPNCAPEESQGTDRVFDVLGTTVIMNDVEFVCGGGVIDGGGIRNAGGTLTLNGSSGHGNVSDARGGAIYAGFPGDQPSTTTLDATTIFDNESVNGGGIYNDDGDSLFVRNGSSIQSNTAGQAQGGGDGGGIWNAGHTEITDSTVGGSESGNIAENDGGGIWTGRFEQCEGDCTLILNGTTVSHNAAARDGGGIYNDSDRVELLGSHVDLNVAGRLPDSEGPDGGNGGGIWTWASPPEEGEEQVDNPAGLYVQGDSSVNENVAWARLEQDDGTFFVGGQGGGIWNRGHAEVSDSTVDDNQAERQGGGVYTRGGPFSLILQGGSVSFNDSGSDGGGIYNEFDSVQISNSTIEENEAGSFPAGEGGYGGNGGGIWTIGFEQTGLFLDSSRVMSNDAENGDDPENGDAFGGDGGGIYNQGHATILNSQVGSEEPGRGNHADLEGGGIWTGFGIGRTLDIRGSRINGNTAGTNGGGIYNDHDRVVIDGSEVNGNSAGGFDLCGDECFSGGDGGGIWTEGRPFGEEEEDEGPGLYVTDSEIDGNLAERCDSFACDGFGDGGGIWNGGHAEISEDTSVSDNIAEREGGGIWTSPSENGGCEICTLLVTDSDVNDNTAAGDGGGIWAQSDLVDVLRSTIDGNRAGIFIFTFFICQNDGPCEEFNEDQVTGGNGGGIWHDSGRRLGPSGLFVSHSAVTRNTSFLSDEQMEADGGGGIWNGGFAEVFNSTISGNEAEGRGGGLYQLGFTGNSDVLSSTIAFNHADQGGGGIAVGEDNNQIHVGLHNSIVSNNTREDEGGPTANDCSEEQEGEIVSNGYNMDTDDTCNLNTGLSDLPATDPLLLPLEENEPGETETHELPAGSPAVDTGAPPPNDGPGCPDDDQRGVIRPQGPQCDRGAYERNLNQAVADPSAGDGQPPPRVCDIIGTTDNDIMIGTPIGETLCGLAGDDVIRAGDGPDNLFGDEDDDVLVGGQGDDQLVGGLGSDTGDYSDAPGSVDADLNRGTAVGEGASTDGLHQLENLIGSPFRDVLKGSSGPNRLIGKKGSDLIVGRGGADLLKGSRGRDTEKGAKGRDLVKGGKGKDTLRGGKGKDTLTGGQKPDNVKGNKGKDSLRGGGHDDYLNGGSNTDACNGGSGNNTLVNCE